MTSRTNAVAEFLDSVLPWALALDRLPPEARGPLHGVPVSLKEHLHLEGHDSTCGLARYVGVSREDDAGVVAMLKSLGAVPFCRCEIE